MPLARMGNLAKRMTVSSGLFVEPMPRGTFMGWTGPVTSHLIAKPCRCGVQGR